ncbi:MAG: M23 family metallopeptidase [Defluviitaleaceae bacterium]|nr:M23 family metallopeptidase [Defluviitaleaceae bacterium]
MGLAEEAAYYDYEYLAGGGLRIIQENQLVGISDQLIYPLWINPLYGRVSSPAGLRQSPISGRNEFHDGIDIAVPVGTAVVAPRAGQVVAVGNSPSFGRFVRIAHGDYYMSFYAHLSGVVVAVGDYVVQGQHFAYSGNTGWSTGPHLHYGLFRGGQFVNPIGYVNL